MNVNAGQKILLRLRYPGDANQFLPLEQVVDTMLHELSHIVFGPHDDKFNALWKQLRDEYQGLLLKGYTGEGFLSEGKKLGGRRVPRDEARKIASKAAEKRRVLSSGSGQKLGGARVPAGTDMRKEIADAIERRLKITKGCGSGDNKDAAEIKAISDEAASNGFRTKAEEDHANDVAIAQALWELGQEEERERHGGSYVSPSAANPEGNNAQPRSTALPGPARAPFAPVSTSKATPPPLKKTGLGGPSQDRPAGMSRLVFDSINSKSSSALTTAQSGTVKSESSSSTSAAEISEPYVEPFWACSTCTCHNPLNFLVCDACGVERPASFSQSFSTNTGSRSAAAGNRSSSKPKTWSCHQCSMIMEDQWWTCSQCGAMKRSS